VREKYAEWEVLEATAAASASGQASAFVWSTTSAPGEFFLMDSMAFTADAFAL
jgi:hypothetical protein